MQVTEAAAIDVGGGDRFDPDENRGLDAPISRGCISATAIGATRSSPIIRLGNLDLWINAGRPPDALSDGISSYINRVLYQSEATDELLPAAAADPSGDAARAPDRPRPPPPPEIRAETILDPGLRKKVIDNNGIIRQLGIFLDAAAPTLDAAAYGDPTLEWLKSAGIDADKLAAADPEALQLLRQAGAKLVFGLGRELSKRPGYANFKMTKASPALPDIAASELIASVLLAKIEEENATLALVDAHKSMERPRVGAAAAALNANTRG